MHRRQRQRVRVRARLMAALVSVVAITATGTAASAAVPDAPKISSATAGPTTGMVKLVWAAPASNGGSAVTGYLYEVSTNAGATWSAPTPLPASPLSSTVPCPAAQTASAGCSYRISATNAFGTGPASAPKAVVWATPKAPQNFVPNAGFAAATVTLNFREPASNGGLDIDMYRYQWSATGTSAWVTDPDVIAASSTSYSVNVPWPCASQAVCFFRVSAHNAAGDGAVTPSTQASFGAPRAVQTLNLSVGPQALAAGDTTIAMTWLEPDTNGAPIDSYETQLCAGFAGCGPTNAIWSTTPITNIGNTLTWQPTCPAAVETCAVQIRAHNAYGFGPWRHKFLTPYGPYALTASPSGTSGNVQLSWSPTRGAAGAQPTYKVFVCTTSCSDDANWADTGLTPGTATTAIHGCGPALCRYRVRYSSTAGQSTLSGVATSNGASAPSAPTNALASPGIAMGSTDLSWNTPASSGTSAITSYTIDRDTGSGYSFLASVSGSTLTYHDTTCGADIACAYRIAAVNAVGTSPSTTASAAGANVPGAATSLAATATTTVGTIDLTWTAPASDGGHAITNYDIERKIGGGAFSMIGSSATTAFADASCGPRVSCTYRVVANTPVGAGAPSTTATATGSDVPDNPTNLVAASGSSSGDVALSWSAPTLDGGYPVTSYSVERNTGSGFSTIATIAAPTTSTTDSGCGASVSCSYRVFAISAVGSSAASNTASATGASVPSAPQDVQAAPGTTSGATAVSWTAPFSGGTGGVTSYSVERDTGNGFSALTSAKSSVAKIIDTTCGAGTTCTYRVRAQNIIGFGPFGNTAAATGADVPAAPSSLMAASSTAVVGAVDLTWLAPSTNGGQPLTGYRLERNTGSGYVLLTALGAATLTYTDPTCGANVSCSYRVAATNVIGDSKTSNVTAAVGASTPGQPSKLTATPGTVSGAVALSWTAPTAGTSATSGSIVERNTGAGFVTVATVTATSYTDLSCGANVTCTYRVAATNVVGTGPSSATSVAVGASLASAPTGLAAATGATLGYITLSWIAPASTGGNPITGYVIERSTSGSGGPFSQIATGIANLGYTDTTCGASTSCTYRVSAITIIGTGTRSNTSTATGADVPSAPALSASTSTSALRYVDLSWTTPTNNGGQPITDYQIKIGAGSFVSLGSTATSFAHLCGTSDHAPATTCTYTVRAVTAVGSGTSSNSTSAASLVDDTAPAPTITSPANGANITSSVLTLSGTAGNAMGDSATVTVALYSGSTCSGSAVQTLSATRSGTVWTVTSNGLAQGAYAACATQTDWTSGPTNTGVSGARTFTYDATGPVPTVALVNGGTLGTVAEGDSFTIVYNEAIAVNSFCTSWSGNGSNQSIGGNGVVTVTITNNSGSTGNDVLTVTSTASGCASLRFGSVDLGSAKWVTSTRSYSGNRASASTISYTAATRTLVVALGSGSDGTSGTAAATISYSPNTAVTDTLGNPMTAGPFTRTGQRF